MKKLLAILSLALVLCSLFALCVCATEEKANPCEGCEICNPTENSAEQEMKPMEFKIDFDAFVSSLGLMGKGMIGIFVVTLIIVGVVAILNWHGKSLEDRRNKK